MFKLTTQRQACSEFLFAPKLEHRNLGHTCLIFRGVDPTFHQKIFTADHPLHQMAYFCVVWSCCNKQIWMQKKSSEKMKCVMWLNMSCFPIERPKLGFGQSRWALTPVNLRTVAYMDKSTSSCRIRYQLSFKARMVSVGWVCSEWQDSECKKGKFQAFPRSTPSGEMQTMLNKLRTYAEKKGLTVNTAKSEVRGSF